MGIDYGAIGQRVQRRRKALGKTQDYLAEALMVSVGYISQIERGVTRVNLETLAKIAQVLGCEITDLLSGVSTPRESYMLGELENLVRRMSPGQRRMLAQIADILLTEEEKMKK
ncbi:helix-turn-helix domain-containing protein [Feifania hominis]|uniref:Helix-turn-helix transcriptional regulator n=1 Tax=Feifania hominis TaxID=2763660 RepID=A0A926HTL7_9FIRM|nr:helix-turn-helix transcriptional regulator [Feifania hominis]MBC8535999.1 helix-turn-helix transcriptional regulator [Feifania hominis]